MDVDWFRAGGSFDEHLAREEAIASGPLTTGNPVLLQQALQAAAARGVDVRLILPARSDSGLVFHAGRSHHQ